MDGVSVYKSTLPTCAARGTPVVAQSPQQPTQQLPGPILIGAEQVLEVKGERAGGPSSDAGDVEDGGESMYIFMRPLHDI